ncbi:MAG: zinc ribbon domain-containing protein [Candidatus Hodarchaeota archaeon]
MILALYIQNDEYEDRYYLIPLIPLGRLFFVPPKLLDACNQYFLELTSNFKLSINRTRNVSSLVEYFEELSNLKWEILNESLKEYLKSNWEILEKIDFLGLPRPLTKGLSPNEAGINGIIYRLKVGVEHKSFSRPGINPYKELVDFFQLDRLRAEGIPILPPKQNRCKACDSEIPTGSTFCPNCGDKTENQVKEKICFYCRKPNLPDAKFCSYCGQAQPICKLCKQPIFRNQKHSICNACKSYFHWVHLLRFVRKKRVCPVCSQHLTEKMLSIE